MKTKILADFQIRISVRLSIACYHCFYYFDSFKNIAFLLDEIFYFFCKPREFINGDCLVSNKIWNYIQNSFV